MTGIKTYDPKLVKVSTGPLKVLFTADWHIRGEAPRCRVDEDWLASQAYDIQSVMDVAKEQQVDAICIIGDLHHQSVIATEALNMLLAELARAPCPVWILPGNHDLPYHAYEQLKKSSLGIVLKQYPELCTDAFGKWDAYPFGKDAPGQAPLRFVHRLVFPNAAARPIEDCGQTAEDIAAEFPGNRVILCGDYHHQFDVTLPDGRRVVNPGCLNVQAADMEGYQPQVGVLYMSGDHSYINIEWHPLRENPMAKVDVDYLEHERVREARAEEMLDMVEKFCPESCVRPFEDELTDAAEGQKDPAVKAMVIEILQEVGNESK